VFMEDVFFWVLVLEVLGMLKFFLVDFVLFLSRYFIVLCRLCTNMIEVIFSFVCFSFGLQGFWSFLLLIAWL